jgi:acetyltransferase
MTTRPPRRIVDPASVIPMRVGALAGRQWPAAVPKPADVPPGERCAMSPDSSFRPVQVVEWHGRQLCMRPLAPRDGVDHRAFFAALRPAALRVFTLTRLQDLATGGIAALAQPASDREIAFIATVEDDTRSSEALGVVRAVADPSNDNAEFILLLDEQAKGRGLGRLLLGKVVDCCHRRGTRRLVGESASEDQALIELARAFGFEIECSHISGVMRLTLALRAAPRH